MNQDEIGSAVRKLVIAILSAYAAAHATTMQGIDIPFIATVAGDLATFAWGIYAHWGMKKVPETARVIPAVTNPGTS